MFDFNMIEIVVIAAMAIIFFGPERLPEFARKTARVIAYLRQIGNDARGQLRAELGPEFDDIRLSDLNPRSLISRHLLSGEEIEDLRQIRNEAVETGSLMKSSMAEASADPDSPGVGSGGAGVSAASAVGTADPEAPVAVVFDPEST